MRGEKKTASISRFSQKEELEVKLCASKASRISVIFYVIAIWQPEVLHVSLQPGWGESF